MNINKNQRIHIIGIGGIGMSGIAEILDSLKYQVQGSDLFENDNVKRLKKRKIKVFIGHKKSNINETDILVYSTAINKKNPEIRYAIQKEIPILSRSEILSQIVKLKKTISISGSHGKTTTTTMLSSILNHLKLSPTVINGGIINEYGTNTRLGKGKWMVVEADESDGTFIKLQSTIAVVTNIDEEHIEFYGSFENLKKSFKKFISQIPFYGFAVVCLDNKHISSIINKINNTNIVTYGLSNKCNFRALNIRYFKDKTLFDVSIFIKSKKISVKNFSIPIIGEYNVLNALAAISVASQMGLSINKIRLSLKRFKGVQRRLTNVGEFKKIRFIDDYAHHPTEINNVLGAIRKSNPKTKISAIFQPHRYSRLISLQKEFFHSFSSIDYLYISDVYSTGEKKPRLFDIQKLVTEIEKKSKVKTCYIKNFNHILDNINTSNSNEIYIFLGAGSITEWPYKILKILNDKK